MIKSCGHGRNLTKTGKRKGEFHCGRRSKAAWAAGLRASSEAEDSRAGRSEASPTLPRVAAAEIRRATEAAESVRIVRARGGARTSLRLAQICRAVERAASGA